MSTIDSKESSEDVVLRGSGPSGFKELVARAENLFRSSDLDGAFQLLQVLEQEYVAATRLFDVMGEVLLRRGDVKEGVRCKTLYEILTNTLSVQRRQRPAASPATRQQAPIPDVRPVCGEQATYTPAEAPPPLTHCTVAMGQELIRQGHYERAVEVFSALLGKTPGDDSLRDARDLALRKAREKRLLGTLERWLQNIEQIKSNRSSGT
jgi:hypothetical protein